MVVSAPQVNIQVVSATLERAESDAIFLAGEPVFVVAEAQNSGDAHGEALLELEVDGDVVAEQVVFVYSPGAGDTPETTTQEVVFEWIPDSAGLFELSVSTVDAGEVQVVSPPQVAITAPTNAPSDFFFIEAEDEERGFFVEVDFAATVIDELDGPLEGDALQWSTSADENNDGTVTRRSLGQGDAFSARLYMANEACGAITEHLIEVKATNSAGLTSSAYHRVILRMGRC